MAKIQVEVEQIANKVKEMFASYIDQNDLSSHSGDQLNNHLVTRALAAYAIFWRNGCSASDAGHAVTDGTNDNGIDALYFNSNTKRITIVQAKFIKDGNSEPEAAEMRTFRDGIYDIIEGRLGAFNEKVQSKMDVINRIKEFGTKIDLILVYTSKEELADPIKNVMNNMLVDLNGGEDDDGVFSLHILHKRRIVSSLTSSMGGNTINLEFLLKDYGSVSEPLVSYYGKLNGAKLQEWWTDHSDLLFRDNIRNSLGVTSVNSILERTIEDQPEHFWFFNNGITVIADSIEKTPENGSNRDYGFFKATNASVVNGAQTYSTIGKCGLRGVEVERVEVPFRVIQVENKNEELKQEITRYNNTQNTILPKDFLSQDPIQLSLQEKLSLSGYSYVIKRDSEYQVSDKMFDYDECVEGLIFTSEESNHAAVFRKEIGRFYNTDTSLYKSIFNPTTNAYRAINAVRVLRDFKTKLPTAVSNLLEKEPTLDKVKNVSDSGYLVIGQCLFRGLDDAVKRSIDKLECSISYSVEDIEEILKRVVQFINTNYPNNYIVTLFQNVEKVKAVFGSI